MSIYQELILDHYHNPRNIGKLSHPSGSVAVNNPLCGDKLTLHISVKNNIIHEIAFSGDGCAISLASASMLTEFAKGKSLEETKEIKPEFVIEMLGIELSPNRLKCALLSLEALKKVVLQKCDKRDV